tara:strand:- start:3194 stop:3799 length:606 start_codon:yes stop_codon:yes gene_type:complete
MTGIVIPDGGNIGSASDPDAISIPANGKPTFSQGIANTGTIDAGTFNGTIGDSITLSQGTWTPTFTNSSGTDLVTTYGTRNAVYTRIGNLVFFNVDINVNQSGAPSSTTNILNVSGLPFFGVSPSSSIVAANGHPGGIVSYHQNINSAFAASYSIHWVLQDTGRMTFYYANGADMGPFNENWLTGTSRMIFSGQYYLAQIT